MSTSIAGLLPGVECVRLGLCGPEEFSQIGDEIKKAQPGPQVIVKPLEGYEFKYSIASNSYRAVRTLAAKRTFTVSIEVATEEDLAHVEACKRLPGVVSVIETTPAVAA